MSEKYNEDWSKEKKDAFIKREKENTQDWIDKHPPTKKEKPEAKEKVRAKFKMVTALKKSGIPQDSAKAKAKRESDRNKKEQAYLKSYLND
jgi:hypothetical protein